MSYEVLAVQRFRTTKTNRRNLLRTYVGQGWHKRITRSTPPRNQCGASIGSWNAHKARDCQIAWSGYRHGLVLKQPSACNPAGTGPTGKKHGLSYFHAVGFTGLLCRNVLDRLAVDESLVRDPLLQATLLQQIPSTGTSRYVLYRSTTTSTGT